MKKVLSLFLAFAMACSLTACTAKGEVKSDVGEEITSEYIGNKNSKKFHKPSCYTLPAPKNRVYFTEREDALKKGYDPCKKCKP